MRLEADLRWDATRSSGSGVHAERLDLATLAAQARSPRRLWRLLRAKRYTEVHVVEDALPPSAVQAACELFVAAIPTSRFVVGGRQLGRAAFLGRALARAAVATPSELLRSAVLARRVSRSSRRHISLPSQTASVSRVLYLRVDPTLGWMGAQVGGAATHTTGVINGLIDNGVSVDVVAAERPLGTERARFVQVPRRRLLQLIPGLAFADFSEEVVRASSGLSAEFVYQRYQLGSTAGLELAGQLGVPLVLEFNGSELWIEKEWFSGRVRYRRALQDLERRNLVDASLVVVVSDALRTIAVSEGAAAERVLVNPNGVDIDALAPYRAAAAAEWRARRGLPDAPTVGFVGTFGLWHGVKLLPALVEAVPEARWIVVGDGPLFPEVKGEVTARGLADRVLLTGLLPHPQTLELLACCDVCVSPHIPNPDGTPFFGSPTKVFEYMGLRKAIVASDLDQIGKVLTHEESALLARPGDLEQTAEAVRRFLADPALRVRLADAAFRLAANEYTWNAHVRRILEALLGRATDPAAAVSRVSM